MMIISKNFTHSIFLIKRKKQYIIFFNLIENILWLTVYNFSHPHWWPQRGAPIHVSIRGAPCMQYDSGCYEIVIMIQRHILNIIYFYAFYI